LRRIAISGLMVLVLGVALAPMAKAAEPIDSFAYLATFGPGESFSFLSEPSAVAVDQDSGRIFVGEGAFGSARIFTPNSSPGGEELTTVDVFGVTGRLASNVAVDSSTDALYASDRSGYGIGVARLVSDGAPTPTYTLDPSFAPESDLLVGPAGIAVDPTTHDLLVADRSAGKVYRLDSSDGSLVSTIDGPEGGDFQAPNAVAVSAAGEIYVVDVDSGRVDRFAADGSWLSRLPLSAGASPKTIAVNPTSGEVAVLELRVGQTVIDGFSASGTLEFSAPFPSSINGTPGGIAWDGGSDRIYVTPANATVHTFVPAVQPGVDPPAGTPGRNTMLVKADVAPGGEATTAWLEYCPATAACDDYPAFGVGGAKNPWKRGPAHEGLTSDTTIEDEFPLYSNASWKLRVTAVNDKLSNSATSTVNSPLLVPTVETQGAASVTGVSAELTGLIDPIGDLTTYHFEYGPTTAYGSQAPLTGEAAAGKNRQPRTVTQLITGLQPETTYHYRLVATNSVGETAGADRTFTTTGAGGATTHAYEMVTPVDQHGALVNGSTNFWSATDGSWFVTGSGAAEPDGTSSVIWQHFLSRRSSTGWSDWSQIDPPRFSNNGTTEGGVAAVSEDGTHALVISNRVLDAGGIEGGGNLYVYDLDNGTFEFVGGVSNEDYLDAYVWLAGLQKIAEVFIWGTPDFSSVVFRSQPPLLPGAPEFQIYRWSRAGGLELESTMPDGEPPSGSTTPPTGLPGEHRQVSDDGSVSYFSIDLNGSDYGVYRRADGQTTAISVIEGDPTHTPWPGRIEGVSRDGRYAIFSSLVALTPDDPGTGVGLYRYDADEEAATYLSTVDQGNAVVAGVSGTTQTAIFTAGGPGKVLVGNQIRPLDFFGPTNASISSSGRYLGWISGREVFLYDAATDTSTCVSCLADGSAGGDAYLMNGGRPPGNRAPRLVFDNGLIVFSTKNQLVTEDQNDRFDVYTYQNGKLTLISPGDGPYDALVVEAAAEGRDIFFSTDQGLIPRDTNNVADVYDARAGGGFTEPAPATECEGEACKGPLTSPAPRTDLGTSALGKSGGSKNNPIASITRVKKLTAADRAALARGGKAHLKVKVGGPGKVTVTGKASGSARAKKAGTVSVPISLTKSALSQLKAKGSLTITLTVHFDGTKKAVSMTLRTTTSKKGGSR